MDEKRTKTLNHWNLERWPFARVPGAEQFYPTAGRDETLARIEYLVAARRRLGALLGTAGTGKSTLLGEVSRRLRKAGCAVVLVNALGTSPREFFWQIAVGLQTSPSADADMPRLWRLIVDRVAENRLQNVNTVLLLDDGGEAGADVVVQLARLARIDASPLARWTMVLAAEASQAGTWNKSLRELIDLRIEVEAWEAEDTIGFLQNALIDAGCMSPLFDDAALRTLHELSGGVPRQVCRLADFSLLAGAAAGADQVDEDLVRVASEEVTWPELAMSAR